MTEGIADYIRWFLYDPQRHGPDEGGLKRQNLDRVRYNSSYRVTANFFNYVVEKYDRKLITKLNSAARQGKYVEELWKEWTGKTVQELGAEWKTALAEKLGNAQSLRAQPAEGGTL